VFFTSPISHERDWANAYDFSYDYIRAINFWNIPSWVKQRSQITIHCFCIYFHTHYKCLIVVWKPNLLIGFEKSSYVKSKHILQIILPGKIKLQMWHDFQIFSISEWCLNLKCWLRHCKLKFNFKNNGLTVNSSWKYKHQFAKTVRGV